MFRIKLSIKIFLLSAVFSAGACHASEREKVENFADEARALISSGNRAAFGKLPVYPRKVVSEEALSYLFGNADNNRPAIFFGGKSILTGIYGPYARKDANEHSVYSIIYYDSSVMVRNEKGTFGSDQIREHWGTAFLETAVVVVDGIVMFHRTPFYYGSHAPWAEDYG
uniref:Uncharacterized protein n=1 Tax=Candidatus Kentrum sp. MB TaxID=2138164 RepID=A0A450XMI3_9GAMM|nr:MAG: hypothetical protein BECKMB1821G_GA0114241_100742 [Candidatus Kentron sp. MB]VFK30540.1 MAG: hypothetical protein BECKMB1821I_GA0114274_101624 [Candidatus Kentron sp. MB]VFK75291.1 MAG: hypothetical protein BECKMB1821H_GA0114242_101923 [Candidatus Kentron sp. MB]